jgi:hypothetical protein
VTFSLALSPLFHPPQVNFTCLPDRKNFQKIRNLVFEKACFIRAVPVVHPRRCSTSARGAVCMEPYQRQLDCYLSEIASGENTGSNTVKLR